MFIIPYDLSDACMCAADLFPTKIWCKQAICGRVGGYDTMKWWNDEIRGEREYLKWMNIEHTLDIYSCASHDHVPCDGFRTSTRYKINFESHRWHWCISCIFPATSWFSLPRAACTQHISFSFYFWWRIWGKEKAFSSLRGSWENVIECMTSAIICQLY